MGVIGHVSSGSTVAGLGCRTCNAGIPPPPGVRGRAPNIREQRDLEKRRTLRAGQWAMTAVGQAQPEPKADNAI